MPKATSIKLAALTAGRIVHIKQAVILTFVPGECVTDLGLPHQDFHLQIIDLKRVLIPAQIVDLLFQVDDVIFVKCDFHF
jgi:hypothetical protein